MKSSSVKPWQAGALTVILVTVHGFRPVHPGLRAVFAAESMSQSQPPPQNQLSRNLPPEPRPFGHRNDDIKTVEQVQVQKAQSVYWQKQLMQDTTRLLQLAKQLKEEVDKANGSTLPADVIKKATEIDKLTKSVKSAAAFSSQKQYFVINVCPAGKNYRA